MTASVVTISSQLGSGGTAMARAVAEALGYRYYDWQITSQAASLAGVSPEVIAASERVPGFLERVLNRLLAASAVTGEDNQVLLTPDPSLLTSAIQTLGSEDYRRFIERVIEELGDHGEAVIVGHAGQATLKGRPGVLKVLVHGSEEARARRLVDEERGGRLEEALKSVRDTDRDRKSILKGAYKVDWLSATVYDLCVNTDHIAAQQGARLIIAAAKAYP